MPGTPRNRHGDTRRRQRATRSLAFSLQSTVTAGPGAVAQTRGVTGRPLRRTVGIPLAQANRSPSSVGAAKAKTTPSTGFPSWTRPMDTADPRYPLR